MTGGFSSLESKTGPLQIIGHTLRLTWSEQAQE